MADGQSLRLSRICSHKNNFEKHLEEMKSWFRVRGYPDKLVKYEVGEVCFSKITESKSKSQDVKGLPLVKTFHPKLKSIGQMCSKHLLVLYIDQETKKGFTTGPMATFCSARKLSSYIVMAKLHLIERIVGSHK